MKPVEKLKIWLKDKSLRDRIARSLPPDLNVDSWIDGALVNILKNDRVAKSTAQSLLACIMEAATLGLNFDNSFGQLYLESRWRKDEQGEWSEEAQLQIGYRGLITLAFRSDPTLVDVESEVVYQRDEFSWEKGSRPFLRHFWNVRLEDRGKPVAVYTGLRYANDHYTFKIFPYEKLLRTRDNALKHKGYYFNNGQWWQRSKKGPDKQIEDEKVMDLPWFAHEEAMVIKTAIRQSSRWWRLGGAFERAAQLVMEDDEGLGQTLDNQAALFVAAGEEKARHQVTVASQASQAASTEKLETLKEKALEQARAHKGKANAPDNQ